MEAKADAVEMLTATRNKTPPSAGQTAVGLTKPAIQAKIARQVGPCLAPGTESAGEQQEGDNLCVGGLGSRSPSFGRAVQMLLSV